MNELITQLYVKLLQAEELIRDLVAHEGAEGFSESTYAALEAYEFETKHDTKAGFLTFAPSPTQFP